MFDAAVYWPPTNKAYLFVRDHYVRYRLSGGEGVEEVVPFAENRWTGLPYTGGIQAATAVLPERVVYFFKGDTYAAYSFDDVALHERPEKVRDLFNLPTGWQGDYDTVMFWPPNGKLYFFKGSHYLRYNLQEGRAEDKPLPIADHWPGLTFSDVGASFVGGRGTAYFFKEANYIRYVVAPSGDRAREAARSTADHWPGLAEAVAGIPGRGGSPVPTTSPPTTDPAPSTFDTSQPGLLRGRIFFRQREATLGGQDDGRRDLLRTSLTRYGSSVAEARNRTPHVTLPFAFVGYASPEDAQPGPDGIVDNRELAEVRSQKVAEYAKDVLIAAGVRVEELQFHITGFGEDPAGQGVPEELWPLFRRVEVLGPPADVDHLAIKIPTPWTPRPLDPVCAGSEWDIRLVGVLSTPLPVVTPLPARPALFGIGIDVKDATGRYKGGRPQRLNFLGVGGSSSSISKLAAATAWTRITTSAPICVNDLQGWARYEALATPAGTLQTVMFTGPFGVDAGSFAWWRTPGIEFPRRESADGWVGS